MVKLNRSIFLLKFDELLEKYNSIWNKVSNSIEKERDCKPIYDLRQKMFEHQKKGLKLMRLQILMIEKYLK